MPLFRVKICGITNADDAAIASDAGADAVGLNFFPKSPRYLSIDRALAVADALTGRAVLKVGLFVNHPADEVCRIAERLGLDFVQLHGDEPPELLAQLGGRPVMRAFRVGPAGLGPVCDYLERCRQLHAMPALVLLDSYSQSVYGGSGQAADWSTLAQYARADRPPLVLAGGLNPENVAAAIDAVHPVAVDVASGVEARPGRKDPELVAQFVSRARAALAG